MLLHNMKKIELTKGKFALVDNSDFENLNQYNWYCLSTGYAMREYRKNGKKIRVLLHRYLLNAKKPYVVDHIDGNPLNNQRSNLRICSVAENIRHRVKLNKNNISGIVGINWNKRDKIWRARIMFNRKEIFLGNFHNIQGAFLARKWGEKLYFKNFQSNIEVVS